MARNLEATNRFSRQLENEGARSGKAFLTPKKITGALSEVQNTLNKKFTPLKPNLLNSPKVPLTKVIKTEPKETLSPVYDEVYHEVPFIDDYIDLYPGGLAKLTEKLVESLDYRPPTPEPECGDDSGFDFVDDLPVDDLPGAFDDLDDHPDFEPMYIGDFSF
ncbi:uncharacterized protein LOC113389361 [Ctenocephalides felis]|uniref:uncharacterized protein LOC113389361 n=1 Tax=Ctenocephalides felis TaxID=7515 RepID=UPI000E6E1B28|nr:uncharacterized protein LOC113389361 [Ctenocephalides felis]